MEHPKTKISWLVFLLFMLLYISCKQDKPVGKEELLLWTPYNDSSEVAANQDHEIKRMRYQLIQSKVLDKNEVFAPLYQEVSKMSGADYRALRPLILEQDIPTIQAHIASGMLTYEQLVLFYLYRIYTYELDNATTLNTVIALNENVVAEARKLDALRKRTTLGNQHPIYGMPILLKDNINAQGMTTTAGSIALEHNITGDAFVVRQLKRNGALILGKVNLSEWAYYLCEGCPVGYSAIGGQTLNPYGRRIFETGGSSSGSGTAVAANYAVAAVGTETSGSILSPSGQNSVVGLKPTIGLLSRSGIVPISSTLDTPGPMTKNVTDNAIVLSAMTGRDEADTKSVATKHVFHETVHKSSTLEGKRLGALKKLLEEDPIYKMTVEKLRSQGAVIVEVDPPSIQLKGFLSILNIDMRNDLPRYLGLYANRAQVPVRSIADLVTFNAEDSVTRIPYGQALFRGILKDTTTQEALKTNIADLEKKARTFFDAALDTYRLDAILSINNYHAGYAAVAKYPALGVPMAYQATGQPMNLTLIGKPFQEALLLEVGIAFEQATNVRKIPPEMAN